MASLLFTEEECSKKKAAHSDTEVVAPKKKVGKRTLKDMELAALKMQFDEAVAVQQDALNRLHFLRVFLEERPDKEMDIHEVQWLRQLCDLSVIPQTEPTLLMKKAPPQKAPTPGQDFLCSQMAGMALCRTETEEQEPEDEAHLLTFHHGKMKVNKSGNLKTEEACAYDEGGIQMLMELGCTREKATGLLRRANGNTNDAAELLFM